MTAQKDETIKIKKTKNPITGLINVTGEPDTGKTFFALSSGAAPERTVFIDDDVKGQSTVREIREATGRPFGIYHNLVEEGAGLRELDFHNLCLRIIEEIEPNKYDVLIWDTWTHFENTFQPVVASNPTRFRQFYSAMGQIKGAEQWQASFDYEASILAKLVNIAPLVILTSHLKKDQTRVRDIAESKKPLIQKARMRVWLRHNPGSPQPIGLMLKRLGKMELTDEGLLPVNVTHRKVVPLTWKKLIEYWSNPVGETPPSENERLNEYELSILDGILTRDQKEALRLAVIEAEKEREEEKQLQQLEAVETITTKKENHEVPEVAKVPEGYPATGVQLLGRAFAELHLNKEQVEEALGKEFSEINNSYNFKYWDTLKAYTEKGKADEKPSTNTKEKSKAKR